MLRPPLTLLRLKHLLAYNPSDGSWIWRIDRSLKRKKGSWASMPTFRCGHHKNYIRIEVDGTVYMAHILAFFYMTGKWPTKIVDHRDGDVHNNSWDNLREATRQQNVANSPPKKGVKYKGVQQSSSGKWEARISTRIGVFDSPEEAAKAYQDEAERRHGEFAYSLSRSS